ncbi:hypothetical protein GQ53DRAFT_823925 [Thozetella sp. PMI_491]|nr:hypothetical protein GQ53DRAFT_823925 [Thozetella sp. PMI_491]
MPTNFRTYEAQTRLLAAVIAAHPELKLNYKAIAQHSGSGVTMSSIEHRFRPIKEQGRALREALAKGIDPKDLNIFDKNEIARIFGSSTPDGMQFQFRAVKKEAASLLEAANQGTASFPQTPKKGIKTKDAIGSGKTGTPSTAGNSRSKRKGAPRNYREADSKEGDSPVVDYDALDVTPVAKKTRTQASFMTNPDVEKTVKAIEDAPAVVRTPAKAQPHRQQATPSETDGSAQTSPMLKEEHDFGTTNVTATHNTNTASVAATEYSSLFPGGSTSMLPAAFTHFGGNNPDAFSFSFASDRGGSQDSSFGVDFGGASSFGYSHQSFTDGEV